LTSEAPSWARFATRTSLPCSLADAEGGLFRQTERRICPILLRIKSYSLTLAFAALALAGCGQLDASAVAQQAISLKSTVAEAELLAGGAAQARYPARFIEVRAQEISDDAAQAESSLQDSGVAPSARPAAAKLRDAARQVVQAMNRLSRSPDDSTLAARLKAELETTRAALNRQ
jgi:hypothetical protein